MPNWCYTEYTFKGDKKEIEALSEKLEELKSDGKYKETSGFGSLWLGNVLTIHGFDWNDYPCRGSIGQIYEEDDNSIKFSTETAWGPMHQMWHVILDKYYPSIEVEYISEEPGMCIYETNRTDVEHPLAIEISTPNAEYFETFYPLEDVLALIKEVFNKTLHTLNELYAFKECISSEYGPIWLNFYEYSIIPF